MASAPPLDENDGNLVRSPELPYVAEIPGGLFPGRVMLIKGTVLPSDVSDSKRFYVDLCCGLLVHGDHMDNKALHFNPRFEPASGWFGGGGDTDIVINTLLNNTWGAEERYKNAFVPGEAFTLRILAFENYFKIAVNGKHLCDFAHRIPLDQVRCAFLGGCIRVDYIEFQPAIRIDAEGQPTVSQRSGESNERKLIKKLDKPVVPVNYRFESGFVSPQIIHVTITPFLSGERFTINFMCGPEWMFHFRVDLPTNSQKTAIVRNSTCNGVWLKEERSMANFPFSKGVTSDVIFTAFRNSVEVDVDGVPFVKFVYRDGDDPSEITHLTSLGDLLVHRLVHKG